LFEKPTNVLYLFGFALLVLFFERVFGFSYIPCLPDFFFAFFVLHYGTHIYDDLMIEVVKKWFFQIASYRRVQPDYEGPREARGTAEPLVYKKSANSLFWRSLWLTWKLSIIFGIISFHYKFKVIDFFLALMGCTRGCSFQDRIPKKFI